MKNKNIVLASILLSVAVTGNVGAKEGLTPYAGVQVNYNLTEPTDSENSDNKWNFPSFGLGGGAKYGITNEAFVGADVFLNYGQKEKGDEGKVTVSTLFDVKVNGGYNFTKEFGAFVNVGITQYKLEFKDDDESNSETAIALTYGLGVSYAVNDQIEAKLSYNLANPEFDFGGEDGKIKFDASSINLGVNYNF
jgi:opacity protein-like surface antigen